MLSLKKWNRKTKFHSIYLVCLFGSIISIGQCCANAGDSTILKQFGKLIGKNFFFFFICVPSPWPVQPSKSTGRKIAWIECTEGWLEIENCFSASPNLQPSVYLVLLVVIENQMNLLPAKMSTFCETGSGYLMIWILLPGFVWWEGRSRE